jgi:hypothetical protein
MSQLKNITYLIALSQLLVACDSLSTVRGTIVRGIIWEADKSGIYEERGFSDIPADYRYERRVPCATISILRSDGTAYYKCESNEDGEFELHGILDIRNEVHKLIISKSGYEECQYDVLCRTEIQRFAFFIKKK